FRRGARANERKLAREPPPKGGIEPAAVGFGTLKGRLPWPTEGRIVTGFGAQVHPRFGTRTFRNGVDIEAAVGRDVSAVHAGHVVYTGWFKGYGNLIIVDHGNEYYTLYATSPRSRRKRATTCDRGSGSEPSAIQAPSRGRGSTSRCAIKADPSTRNSGSGRAARGADKGNPMKKACVSGSLLVVLTRSLGGAVPGQGRAACA